MDGLIAALRDHVMPDFGPDCVGHDISHLDRVFQLACRIANAEGGDPLVLGAASYLHDYHRVLERDGIDDRDAAEERVRAALRAVSFPEARVDAVIDCVDFTDRYSFAGHELSATCVEAKVVRDADNLDALGAVGIARAFMFGGTLREPLWAVGPAPAEVYRSGPTSSVIHHFFEKLLRVRDDMLTPTARTLADERHEYMVAFVERLSEEWEAPGLVDALAAVNSDSRAVAAG